MCVVAPRYLIEFACSIRLSKENIAVRHAMIALQDVQGRAGETNPVSPRAPLPHLPGGTSTLIESVPLLNEPARQRYADWPSVPSNGK